MITKQREQIYARVIARLKEEGFDVTNIRPEHIDLVFMSQFDLVSKLMDDPETKSIILPGFGIWSLRKRVKSARPWYYSMEKSVREALSFFDLCREAYKNDMREGRYKPKKK